MPGNSQTRTAVIVLTALILGGLSLAVFESVGQPASHPLSAASQTGRETPVPAPSRVSPATRAAQDGGEPFGTGATSRLCQSQTLAADAYTVQNNEWGSSAAECITAARTGFTVADSAISNSTSGAPGGYPSIYRGCHWGDCTAGSRLPVQVADLSPGTVTTTWETTQPASGDYDVAYDIWFNQTPATSGQPDGTELMIWLNHDGPVQPFGSQVATATIAGRAYDVWFGKQAWNTVSYSMTEPATSVSDLDIGKIVADAVGRGYISSSWYLIDVEAGFELWRGGAGLATDAFSVSVGTGHATVTTTPSPAASTPATGTATACTVAYTVTHSWPGGFQAALTATDTGQKPLSGWTLGWTFPADERITDLWNGVQAQSRQSVVVSAAPYDSLIQPGASVSVGFTADGPDTPPAVFTLDGTRCGGS